MQRPDESETKGQRGSERSAKPDDQQDTLAHAETGVWNSPGVAADRERAPPEPAPSRFADRRFGDYQLLQELGRGGMGVVYRARQFPVDRIVALKTILGGRLASDSEVARFYVEAKAAGKLSHPNVVRVYEAGEIDGQHYYSMEMIEGESLADRAARETFTPHQIAQYLRKIALAVQYAHDNGILHRDLKPANILIDEQDQPRIADFGLAKERDTETGLTRSGAAVGTPSYMSPEQAAGQVSNVGPASDIYALGAMMYELLVGRPPFVGETAVETLTKVVHDEPPAIRRNCPRDLESICLKCLRKKPEARYASAGELADDLDRFLAGQPVTASSISPLERGWYWTRDIPLVAAIIGRPTVRATGAHRLTQWLVLGAVASCLASWMILRSLPEGMPDRIRIAAGQPGGIYQEMSTQLKPALSATTQRPVISMETSGSVENCRLLLKGEANLAFVQEDALELGKDRVQVVAPLYYEPVFVVVRRSSGITRIADLQGRTVAIGAVGSGSRISAAKLLDHYGIGIDTILRSEAHHSRIAEDGSFDAAIFTTGLDSTFLKQIIGDDRFELLSLEDAEQLARDRRYIYFSLRRQQLASLATAANPSDLPETVETVATAAFLVVRRRSSDALVTATLRAIYEHNSQLVGSLSLIPFEQARQWNELKHPAAQRYYSAGIRR